MLAVLLEAAVRATLIVLAIAIVLLAMRVRQTTLSHAVWTVVVVIMLLLPVWIAWGPRTALPLLGPEAWQSAMLTRTAAETAVLPDALEAHAGLPADAPHQARLNWGPYVMVLYLAGLGVLLVRLVIGTLRVKRLLRGAVLEDCKLTHAACSTPVTVGWVRPKVILPESWSGWPERQLSAILAHETEHVRRRDPLIQWLALLNRAVFWFHPLAWWLERELSRLAEEACDAAVLARGYEPREYAEYLLTLARSVACAGARVKVLGMAAPGTGLPQRIRKILERVQAQPASRARHACVVLASAASAVTFTVGSLAHAQLASPVFEAASIKPNRSGEQGGSSGIRGATYSGRNVTLKRVIRLAYGPIQEFVGGPGWIDSETYDITAKAEGNPSREQLQLMMRSLLADRFKLVVRKETRDLPAYALVLARRDGKLGPSLRRSNADCSPSNRQTAPAGSCGFNIGDGALAGRGTTMDKLAAELILTGRLVVDRTGLTGSFDMDMKWTPDELATNADLLAALQEQLGLKLEAIRAPVEVIVIESASKPSEN